MRNLFVAVSLAIAVLGTGLFASDANALTISILGIGDSGTTADGTIFTAEPNPTNPATGTGVFKPFFRVGAGNGALVFGGGLQLGFNTDASGSDINFDTKDGSNWTRSVLFGDLGLIDGFYVLSLDANQTSKGTTQDNQITITNMQIYIESDPNLANPEASNTGINGTGYAGTLFDGSSIGDKLLGHDPVWSLDSADNGDVNVILQASICDNPGPGQCGSGHGDLDVLIPQIRLPGSSTDFFVLYTEYSGANDGFEEWRYNDIPAVPEPATLLLLGSGLMMLGLLGRRGEQPYKGTNA